MAHDVFISHSAKNKTTADAVCAMLESVGIRCWIAPRDVLPGMEWGECIIDAIEQARVMVLIFTAEANTSPQIHREVERAVTHGVAILPLRIEDVLPGKALEYFIGNVHWLDALTPPLEAHLKQLAGTIQVLLSRMPPREAEPTPPQQPAAAWTPPVAPGSEARREAAGPIPASGFTRVTAPGPSRAGGAVLTETMAAAPSAPPSVPAPSSDGYPAEAASAGAEVPGQFETGDAARVVPFPQTRKFAALRSRAARFAMRRLWRMPVVAWLALALLVAGLLAFFAARPGPKPPPPPPSPQALGRQAQDLIDLKRYGEAKVVAEKACAGGDMDACGNLGYLYYEGDGVPQDYAQAVSLFKKACDGGNGSSCADLGFSYSLGRGVAKDDAQAAALFTQAASFERQACDAGTQYDCYWLGLLYAQGTGVPQDLGQAAALYNKACDSGVKYACYELGIFYANGTGVARDDAQAHALLQRSCDLGLNDGCEQLSNLERRTAQKDSNDKQ